MAKKLNLNESKEKLFRIMEAINPEFGLAQEDAGDDTAKSILGKKVGDVFRGYDGANEIADKTITYAKHFPSSDPDGFDAIYAAEKYLESEGYDKGSMYFNYPIVFIKKGRFGVDTDSYDVLDADGVEKTIQSTTSLIPTRYGEQRPVSMTKWERLSRDVVNQVDGVIMSKNFRGGDVDVIFFIFPE